MKKLLSILGVLTLVFILTACTGSQSNTLTAPTFVGVSIDGTNPNNGTELTLFYKEKNASARVGVELNNPDNLEIRAVVINGYSYKYTRFTEDSTTSAVYFDMSAGDTLGLGEYEIDDIDYFDGKDVKTTLVTSNNEFNLYVYKTLPSVVRESYSISQNNISIDFNITDEDDVIETGTLVAELFSGETLVKYEIINPGNQTVDFTGLSTNKHYEVKVRATYDLDDADGLQEEVVLFDNLFTTLPTSLPSASISNVVVSSNSVTFDVTYNDIDSVTKAGKLRVVINDDEDNEYPITGSTTGVTIGGLLNDNEYTLQVVSDYDLRDGNGTLTDNVLTTHSFFTSPNSVPQPQIDDLVIEENRILFKLNIDDPDNLIFKDTLVANLYVGDDLVRSIEILEYQTNFQVFNILSDFEFDIEIVASYDLNDGNDRQDNQIILPRQPLHTLPNTPPTVYIDEVSVKQGYVTIDLLVADPSESLKGALVATLFEGGLPVQTIQFNTDTYQLVFSYLIAHNQEYSFEITADYNLIDGKGTVEDEILERYLLPAFQPLIPGAELQNIVSNNGGFEFDVVVMDADNTVEDNSLFVYINGVADTTQALVVGTNHITYSGLESDTEYAIIVSADYNVLDNAGIQNDEILVQSSIKTDPKVVPTGVISNPDSTTETITFDILITDVDNVRVPGTLLALLYKNNELVVGKDQILTVGENSVTFTNTQSDVVYKVKVVVNYDLNNGGSIVEDYPLGEFTVRTEPKEAPTAVIHNVNSTQNSVSFDVNVVDLDDVITGDLQAVLYIDDVQFGVPIPLFEGLNPNVTFSNIYSNEYFNIRIETDYNLNDGSDEFDGKLLTYEFAQTEANTMVTGEIYGVEPGIDSITFNVLVTDPDSVITNNLKAILMEDGSAISEIEVYVGDYTGLEFTGLSSDSEYTIRLVTDYSLRDYLQEQFDEVLDTVTVTTTTRDLISFVNVVNEPLFVYIDVLVDDYFDILYSNYIHLTVYDKDTLEAGDTYIINATNPVNNATIDLLNYYNNHDYQIVVTADIKDGLGGFTTETVFTYDLTTLQKVLQEINIGGITVDGTNITSSVNISLPDVNEVIIYDGTTNKVFAVLKEWNGTDYITIDSVEVVDGDNTIEFTSVDGTDGTSYLIAIEANVDFNEFDRDVETNYILDQRTFIWVTQN